MVNYVLDIDVKSILSVLPDLSDAIIPDSTIDASATLTDISLEDHQVKILNRLFWFGTGTNYGDPNATATVDASDMTFAINLGNNGAEWPQDISYSQAKVLDASALIAPATPNTTEVKKDMLAQYAKGIFGTTKGIDLFTNEDAIMAGVVAHDTTFNSDIQTNFLNDTSMGSLYSAPAVQVNGYAAQQSNTSKNVVKYLLSKLINGTGNTGVTNYKNMITLNNNGVHDGVSGYKSWSSIHKDISDNDASNGTIWRYPTPFVHGCSYEKLARGTADFSSALLDISSASVSNPNYRFYPFKFYPGDTIAFKITYDGSGVTLPDLTGNQNDVGRRSYKVVLTVPAGFT